MRTREEQLEEMAATISDLASNGLCVSYELIKHWVDQAEERARAECAADTRRLDWMVNRSIRIENGFGEPCPRTVLDSCDDILARSVGDFRPAIDAAMEGGK